MIKIKRFYQINEKYFDLVNKINPFENISQISQNKSIFKIDEKIFDINDTGRKAKLSHKGEILATCLYDFIGKEIDIAAITSQVKGEGYGKILMLYLIKKYGYENIKRSILTPDGEKMFAELDNFLNFDYEKYVQSTTKHINKKKLVKKVAINKPLISTFLDNVCSYGRKEAIEIFSDEIENGKIEGYPVSKLLNISEWIDGSVENKNRDIELPSHIKSIFEEIKRL